MSRKAFSDENIILSLLDTARKAGALIMTHYRQGRAVDSKADASPVTEADRAADRLIVASLKTLTPSIPIVSEEGEKPDVTGAEYFWLVDPLDGTRSFIRGQGYFTVNIGLIENGVPVVGIIYDPVADIIYWNDHSGAYRAEKNGPAMRIHTRVKKDGAEVALVSHSALGQATKEYLVARGVKEHIPCASSIKFCFLAEGKADIYPRFGPTMEWDTAAGHAILLAAGGTVTTPENLPFLYGKPQFLNGNFLAKGFSLEPLQAVTQS